MRCFTRLNKLDRSEGFVKNGFMAFKKMKVYRKPTLTFLILKTIFDLGFITIDSFFPAKYPQTRIWRKLLGLDSSYQFSKQSFSVILNRLQKQGLIARKNSKWSITGLGRKIIGETKFKPDFELPLEDGKMRLIIFDIPERERKKRLWLRLELVAYGYRLLQKSVWVGYRPLSEEFFRDLEGLNLRSHVHIFSIHHKGTLKEEN